MNIQHSRKFDDTFTIGDVLGYGAFSDVAEASHKHCSAKYAVKVINKCNLDEDEYDALKQEVDILYSLSHKNVLKLCSVYNESETVYLVMELLRGGELSIRLDEKKVYEEGEALELSKCILKAVKYLHRHQIAHRDLKPENLLLVDEDNDTKIKIIDFGFSKRCPKPNSLTTQCGTLDYTAPEVLAGKPYGTIVDMWSVGVIIYTLLCGYEPFDIGTFTRKRQKILMGKYDFHEDYWSHISDHARNLIQCLLNVNPKKRHTAKEACRHPWFESKHNCDDITLNTVSTFGTALSWKSSNTSTSWRNLFARQDSEFLKDDKSHEEENRTIGAVFRNTVSRFRRKRDNSKE